MAKQVKALQLLSHIVPHEGQLIVPKSSLQNRPLVFLPIPPPLLPKDTPQEGRFVSLWLVCSPHTHGVLLGGLVVVCKAVVRGRPVSSPTVCPAPHTASLCLSHPYFSPLLHDCFPCRTSQNHRAWHYLQTSHLPTSVYQIQGVLSGADRLTGALFSSHEGSCTRPHRAPCILPGVTCFWKEQGDLQHETHYAMGWLRWNDSHFCHGQPQPSCS